MRGCRPPLALQVPLESFKGVATNLIIKRNERARLCKDNKKEMLRV